MRETQREKSGEWKCEGDSRFGQSKIRRSKKSEHLPVTTVYVGFYPENSHTEALQHLVENLSFVSLSQHFVPKTILVKLEKSNFYYYWNDSQMFQSSDDYLEVLEIKQHQSHPGSWIPANQN